MGLKSTIKDMFSSDDAQAAVVETTSDPGSSGNASAEAANPSKTGRKLFNKRTSLPPGTGPGTSGHPAATSEIAMQDDLERSKAGQSTSGYGSDAAAALGGSLAGTHQGIGIDRTPARDGRARAMNGDQVTTASGGQALPASYAKAGELGSAGAMRGTRTTGQTGQGSGTFGAQAELLGEGHHFGHTEHKVPFPMKTGSQEHRNILRPVVHQKVRHVENEEIVYVKERERHLHHVQHHTHPIIVTEESPEILRDNMRKTVSQVQEIHSSKNPEDRVIFEKQIHQHRDTVNHVQKERSISNKGTTVNETIHHHIHHVIQPVIEKEVIKKERIRTTVPIHEVIHEAPVIHQGQSYNPMSIDLFVKEFGPLVNEGMTHDEIIKEVLGNGKCVREGDALDSFGEMNLGNKNAQGTTAHTHTINNIGSTDEGYGVPSKSGTQHTAPLDQTTFPQPIVMP